MSIYTVAIPRAPTSVNALKHWTARNREAKDWRERVAICALAAGWPRTPAFLQAILEIELHYVVGDKHGGMRFRDADNIVKITQDAVVAYGILKDDRYPHLWETRLRARPATDDQVVLTIRSAP